MARRRPDSCAAREQIWIKCKYTRVRTSFVSWCSVVFISIPIVSLQCTHQTHYYCKSIPNCSIYSLLNTLLYRRCVSQRCCRYSFGNMRSIRRATHCDPFSTPKQWIRNEIYIKTMDELFSRSLCARRHGTTAECDKDENKTRQMEKETKHLNSVDEIIMCALWPLLYMYRFVAQTGLHSAILLLLPPPLWLWGIVLVFSALARPDIHPIFYMFRSMNRSLAVRFQLLPVTGVGSHYNIVAICVLGYFSPGSEWMAQEKT